MLFGLSLEAPHRALVMSLIMTRAMKIFKLKLLRRSTTLHFPHFPSHEILTRKPMVISSKGLSRQALLDPGEHPGEQIVLVVGEVCWLAASAHLLEAQGRPQKIEIDEGLRC